VLQHDRIGGFLIGKIQNGESTLLHLQSIESFFFFFTRHLKGTIEWGVQGVKSLGLRY
jgi:hypothetical protein